MTLVASVALGSSTYAWFVSNTQVVASSVNVNAATAYSLLISDAVAGTYGTTMTLAPASATLTPVSTLGYRAASAGKAADDTDVAAGDVLFAKSDAWSGDLVTSYLEVGKDSTVPDGDGTTNYKLYYTDTAFLKSAQASNLYLDNTSTGLMWTVVNPDGSDADAAFYTFEDLMALTAVTGNNTADANVDAYNNRLSQAQALLKTLRVGYVVTQSTTNGAAANSNKFFVYQLADTAISGASVNSSTGVANGVKNAVGPTAVSATAKAIAVSPTPADYAVAQVDNYASSAIPVLTDAGMATGSSSGLCTPGTIDPFAIVKADEIVQVDIYVWMEGCDYDTVAGNLSAFSLGNLGAMQFGFCAGSFTTP
jgi:hypothetical protein